MLPVYVDYQQHGDCISGGADGVPPLLAGLFVDAVGEDGAVRIGKHTCGSIE